MIFRPNYSKTATVGLLYGESQKKFNELQRATVAPFTPHSAAPRALGVRRINRHTDDELRLENP